MEHFVESSQRKVIVLTNQSAILDTIQQTSITSTSSSMWINVLLVRGSFFLGASS